MTELSAVVVRPPALDDDEVRRRLAEAYRIILGCARRSEQEEATDDETLAGDPSVAGVPAHADGTRSGEYHDGEQ